MRKAIGAAVAAVLASTTAHADTVIGTRFDLTERTDAIAVSVDRGVATLVVTRVVENAAPKSDQALFHLDLPAGAVATRLRTAGVDAKGQPIWFEGELLEAEEAAKRYHELTGIGGYYPKDPALLSWRSQTHLALQVFPVPARSQKTVEYRLEMPMTYEHGAYVVKLPPMGTEALPAKIHVAAAHADDRIEANGVALAPTTTITATGDVAIRLEPRGALPIEGALASFGFASDRNLVHARIAAAPKLSQTPAGASVVVLLDTSRSMDATLDSALAATRAYLANFPGASVEVMTFDRKVRSPFGGPIPAKDAIAKLYAMPTTANGSRLDDALARADASLARSPSSARRILLVTDLRTRAALDAATFSSRALASGAIVHVATVTPGAPALARDDDSPWAALPRKTGGLLWRATVQTPLDATGRAVFEEWVRPKRVEKIVVKGMPADFVPDGELVEGEGFDYLGIATDAVKSVSFEGELWSRPVKWSAQPTEAEGKRWSALVFGSSLLDQLSEKEQMTLAMHGGAVSPVTSYLAIEPGVRPSTEGLDDAELGSIGGIGTGQGFGSGHGMMVGRHVSRIDRQQF
ncbi:MAG TPA: vWA domain-containing protein, partial [Labilithrix sp.]